MYLTNYFTAPPIPDTTREPFTPEQVGCTVENKRWSLDQYRTWSTYIRGSDWQGIVGNETEQVNIKDWYFEGGIKTAAESVVLFLYMTASNHFGKHWLDEGTSTCSLIRAKSSVRQITISVSEVMEKIGADKTPHEARHTFETNLDNAKGNRKCIDGWWVISQRMWETGCIITRLMNSYGGNHIALLKQYFYAEGPVTIRKQKTGKCQ